MKSFFRNPIILTMALGTAYYSLNLEWAVGLSWESGDARYYYGADILHRDIAFLPFVFYLLAILVVVATHYEAMIGRKKKEVVGVYKGLFFLNFLPIGAYLFVMIIDYHASNYFTEVREGYYLWLISNAVIMG